MYLAQSDMEAAATNLALRDLPVFASISEGLHAVNGTPTNYTVLQYRKDCDGLRGHPRFIADRCCCAGLGVSQTVTGVRT
jgi:hypothetical protein